MITYFKNLIVELYVLMLLTCISNFMSTRYYLLFDLWTKLMYITLNVVL